MSITENNHNAFEIICESDWCWRMYCSTCGNIPILRMLENLANDATSIEDVLSSASIQNISNNYELKLIRYSRIHRLGHADWLGYLGLALRHHPSRKVTESWASQLIELLPNNSAPVSKLENILANPKMLLQCQFLEDIETALIGRKWQTGLQFKWNVRSESVN